MSSSAGGSGGEEQPPGEGSANSSNSSSEAGGSGELSGGASLASAGAPVPASLLGQGLALSAALGEVGTGEGEAEQDMGRLQVNNEFPDSVRSARRRLP